MMGYATDETKELMPLTCILAHKLNEKMAECRRDGTLPWIRADTKSMVYILILCYQIATIMVCAGDR